MRGAQNVNGSFLQKLSDIIPVTPKLSISFINMPIKVDYLRLYVLFETVVMVSPEVSLNISFHILKGYPEQLTVVDISVNKRGQRS